MDFKGIDFSGLAIQDSAVHSGVFLQDKWILCKVQLI